MTHRCHWPGCEVDVDPKFWGCWQHWRSLPKRFRDAIWKEYRRGQEVTKRPSAAYLAVALEVQIWIAEQIRCRRSRDTQRKVEAEINADDLSLEQWAREVADE